MKCFNLTDSGGPLQRLGDGVLIGVVSFGMVSFKFAKFFMIHHIFYSFRDAQRQTTLESTREFLQSEAGSQKLQMFNEFYVIIL